MATPSQTFIVRVWLEAGSSVTGSSVSGPAEVGSRGVWRASVTDASSQERRYFPSPESLLAFLERLPSVSVDGAAPEWPFSLEEL